MSHPLELACRAWFSLLRDESSGSLPTPKRVAEVRRRIDGAWTVTTDAEARYLQARARWESETGCCGACGGPVAHVGNDTETYLDSGSPIERDPGAISGPHRGIVATGHGL